MYMWQCVAIAESSHTSIIVSALVVRFLYIQRDEWMQNTNINAKPFSNILSNSPDEYFHWTTCTREKKMHTLAFIYSDNSMDQIAFCHLWCLEHWNLISFLAQKLDKFCSMSSIKSCLMWTWHLQYDNERRKTNGTTERVNEKHINLDNFASFIWIFVENATKQLQILHWLVAIFRLLSIRKKIQSASRHKYLWHKIVGRMIWSDHVHKCLSQSKISQNNWLH